MSKFRSEVRWTIERESPKGFGTKDRDVADLIFTEEGTTIESLEPLLADEVIQLRDKLTEVIDRAEEIDQPDERKPD